MYIKLFILFVNDIVLFIKNVFVVFFNQVYREILMNYLKIVNYSQLQLVRK